jgi:hypothetical protein
MRVARPCKKKDPVQTLATLVQPAISAFGLQCSAAKQMGQTQFRTDLMSASGTSRYGKLADECPLSGVKRTSGFEATMSVGAHGIVG